MDFIVYYQLGLYMVPQKFHLEGFSIILSVVVVIIIFAFRWMFSVWIDSLSVRCGSINYPKELETFKFLNPGNFINQDKNC